MTAPRKPSSMRKYLSDCGIVNRPSSQEAARLVFQAVQVLMAAGAERWAAENIVQRLASGTHCAPKGLCENPREEEP